MKSALFAALLVGAAPTIAQPVRVTDRPWPIQSAAAAGPIKMPTAQAAGPTIIRHSRLVVHHWKRPTPTPAELRVHAANHRATLEPETSGYVNAVQVYPFSDGAIYHVLTAPGEVTDIALQPGEKLGAVAAGDTVRWVIGDTTSGSVEGERTHVLIKPFAPGLSTNVIITTARRTYHLALTSTGHIAMAALSWTYPQDELIALKAAAVQAAAVQPVASGFSVDQLHFGYTISGDSPTWRPLRAFDDGRQTFIEFPASLSVGEAPPLFLVDAKGAASLVNYRVQGRYYVVDRIFDTAELRLGLKHQDIVRISRVGETDAARRRS